MIKTPPIPEENVLKDMELSFYRLLTTRLPKLRGSGRLSMLFRWFYCRVPRDPLVADVHGLTMRLDPGERVDSSLLFWPQLYDWREIEFLKSAVEPGGVFLDVGANIGYYTLMMSRHVGETGRVVAIEADPDTFKRLKENIALNGRGNVTALQVGVADKAGGFSFFRNTVGNRGGHSFVPQESEAQTATAITIDCHPLLDLLIEAGVQRVDAAKFDIEGMEYRVLSAFLSQAPVHLHPRSMVIEDHPDWHARMGGDAVALLQTYGYEVISRHGLNVLLKKSGDPLPRHDDRQSSKANN